MTDDSTTGIRDEQRFSIEAGEIIDTGSWVYVWVESDDSDGVLYVGATGVHPAVRTWLHVTDDDPAVGRVAARYPPLESTDVTVYAFRLDESLDRQAVKRAIIDLTDAQGIRSAAYFGDDTGGTDCAAAQAVATDVVDRIR